MPAFAILKNYASPIKEKETAQKKAEQLERFNKVAVDRELKMKELKKRIEELEGKLKEKSSL